jgi:hypothetical protein
MSRSAFEYASIMMPAFLIISLLLVLSFAGLGSAAEARTARAGAREGSLPNLDIESGCRGIAQYDPGRTVNFDACMKEEREARGQIQKTWRSVPSSTREQCLYLVTPPALPSYVSLQGCLTMAHDAAQLAKKDQASPSTEPLSSAGGQKRSRGARSRLPRRRQARRQP